MTDETRLTCPDCESFDADVTRRQFVKTAGAAALAAGSLPLISPRAFAAPTPKSQAETNVAKFYETLSDEQKKVICFPFNHKLRMRISANWRITKPAIGSDFYTQEQQRLNQEIFKGVTSKDGYERFLKHMDADSAGFDTYHVAVFGKPGSGKFEWELTGRHHTIRADGDSVDGMAFGGPIVYGHGASNPRNNLFHYQTKQANEVYRSLEGKQREKGLLAKAPRENDVPLQGKGATFPGIAVGELSPDQKKLVKKTLEVLLAPYRKEDVDEAMQVLKAGGGLDGLHMAFYKQGDLQRDETWDIWRVEGPTFVWHFRGAPHVHTYVHIGQKATA